MTQYSKQQSVDKKSTHVHILNVTTIVDGNGSDVTNYIPPNPMNCYHACLRFARGATYWKERQLFVMIYDFCD